MAAQAAYDIPVRSLRVIIKKTVDGVPVKYVEFLLSEDRKLILLTVDTQTGVNERWPLGTFSTLEFICNKLKGM